MVTRRRGAASLAAIWPKKARATLAPACEGTMHQEAWPSA